jgi:hypothetical protein
VRASFLSCTFKIEICDLTLIHSLNHHAPIRSTSCMIGQSESPSQESSRLYYLGFKGETRAPKKDVRSKLNIAAANAADAIVDKLAERSASSQTTIR